MKFLQQSLMALLLTLLSVLTINAQIGTPSLSAPISGANYVTTSPTLSWWYVASDYSAGPFIYSVEISTSASNFTTSLVYNTTLSASGAGSLTVPSGAGLVVGTAYYWRVGVGTNYSSVWSFTPSTGNTNPTGYTLSSSVVGSGTVTKTPDQASYTSGSSVSLTATPSAGWTFSGWSGDANGSTSPLSVTMNANKIITATFVQQGPTQYTLAVTNAGTGSGTVTKNPNQTLFTSGSSVTLTATPSAGSVFAGWSGDASGSTSPLAVTMNANKNITATFNVPPSPVLVTPANGSLKYTRTPQFTWNAFAGAVTYNLLVSTQSNFSSNVINVTKQASNGASALVHTVTNPTLLEGTTYYWKVVVTTGSGTVSSGAWNFTTLLPPGPFALLSPFSQYTANTNVQFLWTKSPNATSYRLVLIQPPYSSLDTLLNIVLTDTQYVFPSLPSSTAFQWNVTASNDGVDNNNNSGYFITSGTYYVANNGDNSNPGTEALPFQTIDHALSNVPPASTIMVKNGIYYEDIIISNPVTLIGYGGATPRIGPISIGYTYVNISNFKVINYNNAPTGIRLDPPGGGGGGYLNLPTTPNVHLDRIQLEAGHDFQFGLQAGRYGMIDGLTVTNSNFSYCSESGIELWYSKNILFDTVTTNFNEANGMVIYRSENSTFSNVTARENDYEFPQDGYGSGFVIVENSNLTFNNIIAGYTEANIPFPLPAQFQNYGIALGPNEDISFNGGSVILNKLGVYMTTDNNLYSTFPPYLLYDLVNVTFSDDFLIAYNYEYGVSIYAPYSGTEIGTIRFNPGTVVKENDLDNLSFAQINIQGNVSNVEFDGIEIGNQSGLGLIIASSNPPDPISPNGIKINNSTFDAFNSVGEYAIRLESATNNVDAKNNVFLGTTDSLSIDAEILHKKDISFLGEVDFSGFYAGITPEIAVESIYPAYSGATYLVDVDFNPKTTGYVLLSGKFTYSNTELEYLGFLNNGLINDATWSYFSVANTVTGNVGEIRFTGWGLTQIDEIGKLFSLQMKVRENIGSGVSVIDGDSYPSDFTALSTGGSASNLIVTNGFLAYSAPSGPIAEKGDVTLDGIVTMDDFYMLLLYLGGNTSLITAPQALLNADYDNDSDIDQADLNALYAFISGGSPSPVIAGGGFNLASAVIMPAEKLVQIPLEVISAENLYSLTVDFEYDPAVLNYQSFSSLYEIEGVTVLGYEKQQGISSFIFFSDIEFIGDFNPGNIFLRVNDLTFTETEVRTKYTLNGTETFDGPTLTVTPDGVSVFEEEEIPTKFEIYQNYPNPFNPSTKIKYALPEAGFVSIKVYDILGQLVKSLVNTEVGAGTFEVVWNGTNDYGTQVAAGAYIYRVMAGANVAFKKMILLK